MEIDRIKRMMAVVFICLVLPCFVQARTYRIATVAWMGWSPLHVAEELGFWEDVDVRVIRYDDPIVILEAIKAGKIDLAMDMVASLAGIYTEGEPVVALAETNWSHGGDKIIVRQSDRLENHVGGIIGVFLRKPSCMYFLDQYLQTRGLNLSDFRIIEINARDLSAQFIAGRLPAIVNYEPWAGQALENGNGAILATSADFEGCIPECIWGYRQVVQVIPDRDIRNMLRGWIRAVRWIEDPANREAYFRILKTRTFGREAGLTHNDLIQMRSEVAIHGLERLKERNRAGGGLQQFLRSLAGFLAKNRMLKNEFKPDAFFDNRHIMAVLDEEWADDTGAGRRTE